MVLVRIFTFIFVMILSGHHARADWQYTRWGMNVGEVLSASKGTLKRCESAFCTGKQTEHDVALLFGDYRSGEFVFTIYALFDRTTGKLSGVSLNLKDSARVYSLVGALRAKYGNPAIEDRTSSIMSSWIWRQRTDQMSLMAIGTPPSLVTLDYRPRVAASNPGLFPRL